MAFQSYQRDHEIPVNWSR